MVVDYRNDETKGAVEAREEAAAVGRELGQTLIDTVREIVERHITDPNYDPYLEGLVYINAAQVIANEGRRIAGLDFGKQDKDLEGKKQR